MKIRLIFIKVALIVGFGLLGGSQLCANSHWGYFSSQQAEKEQVCNTKNRTIEKDKASLRIRLAFIITLLLFSSLLNAFTLFLLFVPVLLGYIPLSIFSISLCIKGGKEIKNLANENPTNFRKERRLLRATIIMASLGLLIYGIAMLAWGFILFA